MLPIIWVWNDKYQVYEAMSIEEIASAFGIEEKEIEEEDDVVDSDT